MNKQMIEQERLIAEAVQSGVKITILPEYTPKPRPSHSVRERAKKPTPKPVKNRSPQQLAQMHTKHNAWINHLKVTKQEMDMEQVRNIFGFSAPNKVAMGINKRRGKEVIAITLRHKKGNARKSMFFSYGSQREIL